MNHELIIRTTNRTAVYVCAALAYWTFIFLIVSVFDLRIFRERMTEMFFFSFLGLFALLGGAIVLNLMSNLSKISAAIVPAAPPQTLQTQQRGWPALLLALSFPLLALGLFAGDKWSAQRKKALLIASAERLIAENQTALAQLAHYRFAPDYVESAERTLGVLNKIDKHFPELMLLVPDQIDGKALVLGFGGRSYRQSGDREEKASYIYATTPDERDYLRAAFAGRNPGPRFSAEKGSYQLYMPTRVGGKQLMLYFSDFQRYGKFGS